MQKRDKQAAIRRTEFAFITTTTFQFLLTLRSTMPNKYIYINHQRFVIQLFASTNFIIIIIILN